MEPLPTSSWSKDRYDLQGNQVLKLKCQHFFPGKQLYPTFNQYYAQNNALRSFIIESQLPRTYIPVEILTIKATPFRKNAGALEKTQILKIPPTYGLFNFAVSCQLHGEV